MKRHVLHPNQIYGAVCIVCVCSFRLLLSSHFFFSNENLPKFFNFTNLFFSSNLNIVEPKKPKLGKEKVWDVSPYRNEEMETLRKLGVQIEYLILPTEMSGSANSISMTCCKVPYSRIVEWQVQLFICLFPHVILVFFRL